MQQYFVAPTLKQRVDRAIQHWPFRVSEYPCYLEIHILQVYTVPTAMMLLFANETNEGKLASLALPDV
jgi:hypothetical protein